MVGAPVASLDDVDDSESATAIAMRTGIGNWSAFQNSSIDVSDVLEVAREWQAAIGGATKLWLCWNVTSDWCLAQQRLVESVGWTPVVGFDPRVGPPQTTRNAILIDFNRHFRLPVMYPHFALEFAFAFADRLAFWHSDFLIRHEKMASYAARFESLGDGEMAASAPNAGWRTKLLKRRNLRYWELLGCTTRAASRALFETGCGWWMNFWAHPNCPSEAERIGRKQHFWDHGVGIRYWARHYGGVVHPIPENEIAEGHFTRINNPNYELHSPADWRRDLSRDLSGNYSLAAACQKLGLETLLGAAPRG